MDRNRHDFLNYSNELLNSFNSLSAAVIADAEGNHTFQLAGFLRHRLLPYIREEERNLNPQLERLLAAHCVNSAASARQEPRHPDARLFATAEAPTAADRDTQRIMQCLSDRSGLEKLLADLNAVLRLYLCKEERELLTVRK